VHLISSDTGVVTTLGEHKIKTALSDFIAGGEYLVTGGWDREIIFWDLSTRQRAFTYASTAYKSFWSADGRKCVVALGDRSLQFCTFEQPGYRSLSGNPGEVHVARFSPDGRWLAARCGRELCVWDLKTNAPPAIVAAALNTAIFFSPDSTELFVGANENVPSGYFTRWRVAPGMNGSTPPQLEPLPANLPKEITRVALAPHELIITSPAGVSFAAITNLASGTNRTVSIPVGGGFVSPDGRWLAMVYH
jgi:WD40 repeat protein